MLNTSEESIVIDCLQYANWSETIFSQMRAGDVTAVHVTISYHENFRETAANIAAWNRRFEQFTNWIMPGRSGNDVRTAKASNRTAIFFGLQNCSPIEDDIGLVEICHQLGIRFMQLTYNNQSLLATGCYERDDSGITRMGQEVISEMNRVGLAIDMSHSGERSTLDAIERSTRPIAITHANPYSWHPAVRNKSDNLLRALAESGGMLGLSLYPHHLAGGSNCRLEDFVAMVARTVELMGISHVGIGSDLCQAQPGEVLQWMRNGRWIRPTESATSSRDPTGFLAQPPWFRDNRDFKSLRAALRTAGFAANDADRIMGLNWLEFFDRSFGPMIQPTRGETS